MTKETKTALSLIGIGLLLAGATFATFKILSKQKVNTPADVFWHKDAKTLSIVKSLHPSVRGKFAKFLTEFERKTGLVYKATSGTRTFEHQAQLYNQDHRNARPGYSNHNYGFAIDGNVYDKTGKRLLRKASSKQAWLDSGIVDIAKKHGLKWGGYFKNYHDPIHFYHDTGKSSSEHLALHEAGKIDKQGYIIV